MGNTDLDNMVRGWWLQLDDVYVMLVVVVALADVYIVCCVSRVACAETDDAIANYWRWCPN